MIAPPRLLETEAALPQELRRALRAAPGAPRPDELQALASHLSSALGVTLSAPPIPVTRGVAGAVASKGLWTIASWSLGGAAVGVALSVVASYGSALDRPTPVASASVRVLASASSRALPVAPTSNSVAPTSSSVAPAAPSAQRSIDQGERELESAAEPRESEISLLQRAQQAVARDPNLAFALCEQHAERFPIGGFAQEREVIAIDSLLRLGRVAQARARAEAFLSQYSGSAHARRVQVLLAAHQP